jgi:multidrug efflux pump subunit AcrA (membrane-fusion protein)
MAMDIKRDPKILRKKRIRQIILLSLAGVAVVVISVAVSQLKPAAPSVPSTNVWPGTVMRGSMTREVHGAGTLVPEDIRWVVPTTSGRVEKIILRAGAPVKPGTVILVLSNPDLHSNYNAELALKTSEANFINRDESQEPAEHHAHRVANAQPATTTPRANWTPTKSSLRTARGAIQIQRLQSTRTGEEHADLAKQNLASGRKPGIAARTGPR